uniref:Predicted protein n=1 Tax=Physcomitrium patens TaxID=3218 RepID=A9U5Z0_PHYPA
MRALVQDYLEEHETAARESASYGAKVDDDLGGSTETSEFWASGISIIQEGKLPREALLSTAARIREGNSSKKQTRGNTAREAASQKLPIKDTLASLGEKTKEAKDKGKSIAYKLLSDIEAGTNLKGMLEEHILNSKVEFTLKEVLRIVKKNFHDVIIDSNEEEVDIGYKQPTNEKNGYNQQVHFKDSSDKEMGTLSHYTRKHWARATTEKQKWPIDMEHGWAIQAANNTRDKLYGACPDVKIQIGDVATEQHFFVQDTTSYPLILRQPYITATQMETKDLRILGRYHCKARLWRYKRGGTLQDDERILGVYEENGLEDSLELITSIELGDNDKIVEIHSREVYTILESFQAPEVTVETTYKTADKKVKPVVGPLPEDSKEQMGEASKEVDRLPSNLMKLSVWI